MKRTALILLFVLFSFAVSAQTAADAYTFSKGDYEGSARTVAMGNAFTALGGDLGAININPAGLAVARYGQVVITPGVSLAVSNASGTSLNGSKDSFQNSSNNRWSKFGIPNYGVSLNFDTHRSVGLKGITLGFAMNRTENFLDNTTASGVNGNTSFMGQLAASALGTPYTYLASDDAWDNQNWKHVIGWKSGMISTFDKFDDEYIGNSEIYSKDAYGNISITQAGPLNQSYKRIVSGYKEDYAINLSFNISDVFFIGANLGITSLNYVYDDYFSESAVDPELFVLDFGSDGSTKFKSMKYKYAYTATGSGVFGKFGFIYSPKSIGLRIGAAIQTPTVLHINEIWQSYGETSYTDSKFNAYAKSPEGQYDYNLVTPMSFNVGAAWTLGSKGVLSADYEMRNYASMCFRNRRGAEDTFDSANQNIRDYYGLSHSLRLGAEFKPISSIALRAGYGLTSTGERYYDEFDRKVSPKSSNEHRVSLGVGYSSKGSFFADFAAQTRILAAEYIYPYDDYIFDDNNAVLVPSPEIVTYRHFWNFLLTVGWRF